MDYTAQEKIRELESLVKPFTKINEKFRGNEWDADIQWAAALLFSKIVLNASNRVCFVSRKELEDFKTAYDAANNPNIDLETLFSKYWLREVFGFVHIPGTVREVTNDYEKYQSHFNELLFLRTLFKRYPGQEIMEHQLKEEIQIYETGKSSVIDSEWLITAKWITKNKTGPVLKVGNVDYLFTLIDNWNFFAFLNAFKKETYKVDESKLLIPKKLFNSILKRHRIAFQKAPGLDYFIENGIITSSKKNYIIHLYNLEINYWLELNDKVCALIWEAILDDESFSGDDERLKYFISVVLRGDNWPQLSEFLSQNANSVFQTTAMDLIVKEKDIIGLEDEFIKCFLEDRSSSKYIFRSGTDVKEKLKPFVNPLDFYNQLQQLSNKYQGNLFSGQESRNVIAFLVKEIVVGDKTVTTIFENNTETISYFQNVFFLLKSDPGKPFLMWEVIHFILRYRPEIILYLLPVKEFSSLAFHMLERISIDTPASDINFSIKLRILSESLKLSLNSRIKNPEISSVENAKFIFQIFLEVNKNKFDSVSNIRTLDERFEILENNKEKEESLLSIMEDCKLDNHNANQPSSRFILSKLLPDLLKCVESYEPEINFYNGTIQLPVLKLDFLSWLSKYILTVNTDNNIGQTDVKEQLSNLFKTVYLNKIEQNEVQKKDITSGKFKISLPSWSERNERLLRINWVYSLLVLNETGDMDNFLRPRFKFKKADNEFNEVNRFQGDKVRSHLYVLLCTLKTINKGNISTQIENKKIKELKTIIELLVLNLIKQYGTIGKSHKINILSAQFDRQFFGGEEDHILPFVVEMGNFFENKDGLFELLINTCNINQLLIVLEGVKSIGIRNKILEKIRNLDIVAFLREQKWRPEIQTVVTKSSLYPELSAQAVLAQAYWDSNAPTTNDYHRDRAIFESRLILAYQQNDEGLIQKIPEPKPGYLIYKEFKPSHQKQFFIGLVRFHKKPEESYSIFSALREVYPEDSTIALNCFAAKTYWALQIKEKKLFSEALEEWQIFEKTVSPTILEVIIDKVSYNKLTVLLHLQRFDSFDEVYNALEKPYQMTPDVVELRVQMLLERKLKNAAKELLDEAKEYNRFLDAQVFNILEDLSQKLAEDRDIGDIIKSIQELSNKPKLSLTEQFVQEFEGNDFGRRLTKEIAEAGERLLTKIKAIDAIKDEDKYNDLLQVALESKLSSFSYSINDQSRGGFSATGKNSGERDLVVCRNSKEIAVIEPFIHTGKKVVQSHLTKVFNYTHQRENLFIVIYDLKSSMNFEKRWQKYIGRTLPGIIYPKSCEINASEKIDLTEEFNLNLSAIKVGVTSHANGTYIYHIMININYKLD